jgi:hypothetical protein
LINSKIKAQKRKPKKKKAIKRKPQKWLSKYTSLLGIKRNHMNKEILAQIPKGSPTTYFLIDCGAYIIPYLKYNVYTFNRTNITPFIKLLENFFYLSSHAKDYKFLFFIDNGVPEKIEAIYAAYKKNRKHSRHTSESRIVARNILHTNEYVTNRTLITQFFTFLGQGVFYYNEADYQLGYALKQMITKYNIDGTNCFVISHDKDLMALIGHANCIRIKRNTRAKTIEYPFYPKGDYAAYMEKDEHVYSYDEFVVRKSLMGDKEDNILAPILVKESFVKKLFTDYKFAAGHYEINLEQAFEIVKEKLINKIIKKSDTAETRDKIEERLAFELRRNYLIFDVYNCEELFKPTDRRYMDVILQSLLTNQLKVNYNQSYDVLKRVSVSHADIFQKWVANVTR